MDYTSSWTGFELTILVVIGIDCACSCKFNYHAITTTAVTVSVGYATLNPHNNVGIIKTKLLRNRWSKPILAILLEYLCHKWPVICFVFRINNLILSSRGIRQVPHVEQELLTLPEDLSSLSVLSGVRIVRSLVFCVRFCRSMFVFLSFFFWALCCLSFDLRLPMTPLTSANFS